MSGPQERYSLGLAMAVERKISCRAAIHLLQIQEANMRGPFQVGTLKHSVTSSPGPWERGYLVRGRWYRVVKPFLDSEGDEHAMSEEWSFIGSSFSRFDNEVTLFIQLASREEWEFSLSWNKQKDVIENWQNYVERS